MFKNFPETALPWEVEYGCIVSPTKGELLAACRDNDLTRPTERDSNIHAAQIAMMFHQRLVDALCNMHVEAPFTPASIETRKLLEELAAEIRRRDR